MKRWSKRSLIVLASIIVILVIARLALPYVILHYSNKTLAEMDGYRGHINDIDLALIRGAYQIDSIYLNEVDSVSGEETPFFSAALIDLSLEWKALFKGSIVGELEFQRPVILFTRNKVEPKDVAQDSTDFRELLDDFMPLSVNRFAIIDGRVGFKDETTKPRVDIELTNLEMTALNLKNSYDSSALLPATVTATANVYEGTLALNLKMNPLAEEPTFDMNAELKDTNLVLLNDFFQAYAKVDVNKGTFGLYAEVATKEGGFAGYVKPLMKNLDVLGMEDRKDNIFRKMWEAVAGGASELFENQPNDQVATKIPFEGRLENPKANIWITISNTLRNAFISAIQPSIDHEINIASVDAPEKEEKKTGLQKIFEKDGKELSKAERREQRKKERESKKKARADRTK